MAFRDPSLCSKALHASGPTDPLTINHQLQIQRKTTVVASIIEDTNEELHWRQEGPDSTPEVTAFYTSALGVFNSKSATERGRDFKDAQDIWKHMAVLSSFQSKSLLSNQSNKCLMRPSTVPGTHRKHKYKRVRHTPCQLEAHNLNISTRFKNQIWTLWPVLQGTFFKSMS